MATFRVVTGTVKNLDGSIPYGAGVPFTLDKDSYAAGGILFPAGRRIVAYVGADGTLRRGDKDGEAGVPLWCNASEAESACSVTMRWPQSTGGKTSSFSVPAGEGPIDIAALIAGSPDPATPQGQSVIALVQTHLDDVDAAAAAYAAAEGDIATAVASAGAAATSAGDSATAAAASQASATAAAGSASTAAGQVAGILAAVNGAENAAGAAQTAAEASAASAAAAAGAASTSEAAAADANARIPRWQGEWTATRQYAPGDMVGHSGSAWICEQANQGTPPPALGTWDLLAANTDASTLAANMLTAVKRDGSGQPTAPIYDPGARGFSVHLHGAVGNGTTDDRAALANTDALGPAEGSPGKTYKIASNLTLANGWRPNKSTLKPANGVTVTISGPVEAGLYQWIDTSAGGTVALSKVKAFHPEWWGAKGDGVTDDTAAMDACLVAATGKEVALTKGTHKRTTPFTVPASTSVRCHGPVTILCDNVAGAGVLLGDGAGNTDGMRIYGPLLIGGTATKGLHVNNAQVIYVEDVRLTGTFTDGFVFSNTWNSSFKRLTTNDATISTSCFDLGANVNGCSFDHLYTSNVCAQNFYFSGLGYGNVMNGAVAQRGDIGFFCYSGAGWTFNAPYAEECALAWQFGSTLAHAFVNAVINSPHITGCTATHRLYSTRRCAMFFSYGLNILVNCPKFAGFTYANKTICTFSGGGGSRQAKGWVRVKADGTVDSIAILDAGAGYTTDPTVAITGAGIDATATATQSGGSVASVTITNAGSGYTTDNTPMAVVIMQAQQCEIVNPYITSQGYEPMGLYPLVGKDASFSNLASFRITHDWSRLSGTMSPCDVVRGQLTSASTVFVLERNKTTGAEIVTPYTLPTW